MLKINTNITQNNKLPSVSDGDTGSSPQIIYYKNQTLSQEMNTRLQEYSLVERYGTGIEYGTEAEYSEFLSKKYLILKTELLKVYTSLDYLVSCNDLQYFFSLYESKTNVRLTPIYIERFYEDLFIDVNIKKTM